MSSKAELIRINQTDIAALISVSWADQQDIGPLIV